MSKIDKFKPQIDRSQIHTLKIHKLICLKFRYTLYMYMNMYIKNHKLMCPNVRHFINHKIDGL